MERQVGGQLRVRAVSLVAPVSPFQTIYRPHNNHGNTQHCILGGSQPITNVTCDWKEESKAEWS